MSEQIERTITNTSPDTKDAAGEMGGSYQTYIRFMVPDRMSISEVSIDGARVQSRITRANRRQVLPYVELTDAPQGYRGIGVAMVVPAGSSRKIRLDTETQVDLSFTNNMLVYNSLYYKHPGISGETHTVVIQFPQHWSILNDMVDINSGDAPSDTVSTKQPFIAKVGQLEYNTTIFGDHSAFIPFTK